MPYQSALVFGFVILTLSLAWAAYKSLKALLSGPRIEDSIRNGLPYLVAVMILLTMEHYIMLSIQIADDIASLK